MPIQQRFCAALALVYGFALWSFVGVWWMEDVVDGPRRSSLESARRREQLAAIHERAMKRGLLPNATPAVVFDEPLLNYMYAVKKKPPLAPTPRVFEQRDILLSDPPAPRVHHTNQDLAYHLTCDSDIADSNGPFVPVKSQQPYLMKVHAIPDIVSSAIKSRGMWEENIIRQMQTILNARPKKSLVIDIGANIGFFTTFLASEGHRVIAVEPFGINIGCILATLCHRNNEGIKEHVHLLKAALLDQGAQKMCLWSTNTDVNNGNARLTPEFDGKRDWDQDKGVECMEKVQSFTLDYLLFQAADGPKLSERVMIMKIDIEGSETKALLGSKGLLHSKFAPCYIFFEFQKLATETTGVKATDIFDLLTQAHYKISDVGKPELGVFTRKAWEGVGIGDFVAELMCSSSCECQSHSNASTLSSKGLKFDIADTAIARTMHLYYNKTKIDVKIDTPRTDRETDDGADNTTKTSPRKIIACFQYNGEKQMVWDRANTTLISFFVVGESKFARDGMFKTLFWDDDFKGLWAPPLSGRASRLPPVTYVVEERKLFQSDNEEGRWKQEVAVRAVMGTGIKNLYDLKLIDDNDIVFVTDVDEIVNDATLRYVRDTLKHNQYAEVSLSWFLYTKCQQSSQMWVIPVAVTVKTLRQNLKWNTHLVRALHNPSVVTHNLHKLAIPIHINGYHCSWCFDKSMFRRKMKHYVPAPESTRQQEYTDARIEKMRKGGINWNGGVHGVNICSNEEFQRQLLRFD